MVRFEENETGLTVIVNDNIFGYISRFLGFYSAPRNPIYDPRGITDPEDLDEITRKLREFKKWGEKIPICPECGQTPLFPKTLYEMEEIEGLGKIRIVCGNDFHQINK